MIHFTKMHGLANDFVVINSLVDKVDLKNLPISQLADRHTGIGFDQLLVIEPSQNADFFMRIFNSDGSEAEQCGNGLRCIARFIHENGLYPANHFRLETNAGIFPVSILDYDHITVMIVAPNLDSQPISIAKHEVSIVSLGNPHAITKVSSIDAVNPAITGPIISSHSSFPQGANVGFMEVIHPHHIRLRTFERGAGETLACGSNACAAALAGMTNGWLAHPVRVEFQYGSLLIEWEGGAEPVKMTGPAVKVFSGQLEWPSTK